MSEPLSRQAPETLERMIDGSSLREVIEALADIAHEKSAHVRSAWQDKATARVWAAAGRALETAAAKVRI